VLRMNVRRLDYTSIPGIGTRIPCETPMVGCVAASRTVAMEAGARRGVRQFRPSRHGSLRRRPNVVTSNISNERIDNAKANFTPHTGHHFCGSVLFKPTPLVSFIHDPDGGADAKITHSALLDSRQDPLARPLPSSGATANGACGVLP
jgi:hypothetical protein